MTEWNDPSGSTFTGVNTRFFLIGRPGQRRCAALLSYLVVAVLVTHQWGSVPRTAAPCGTGRSGPAASTTRPPCKPAASMTCPDSSLKSNARWTPATAACTATTPATSASRRRNPPKTRPQKRPAPGSTPATPVTGQDLRRARYRRQQELAAPATLDRQTPVPARNHPGHRITGIRPRRGPVTRWRTTITPAPQARTSRT